jgi:putative tryptophan/tyrosine transport system substrate-binding protein
MDRRAFLAALVVAWGCSPNEAPKKAADANHVTPTGAEEPGGKQQSASVEPQTKVPRVAMLVFGTRGSSLATAPSSAAILVRNRLTELGYVEGKTILFEESYADGDPQRLTQLAHEVVERKPDVIVAIAAAATAAARQETSTIPIVMAHAGNPVGSGLVVSLAQPGGNVTGTTSMVPDLGIKQVEILRELIPRLASLGVLANPTNAGMPPLLANVNEAARRFNINIVVAEGTRADDFDKALGLLRDARPDALLVMIEPLIFLHRARVLDFAATNRLPTSYDVGSEITRQGGLISYGPVLTTHYALVAHYVDKILKGAKPGDLPVQQPTQFALIINLKTAKALGLTIPQSLLARADEVIQ